MYFYPQSYFTRNSGEDTENETVCLTGAQSAQNSYRDFSKSFLPLKHITQILVFISICYCFYYQFNRKLLPNYNYIQTIDLETRQFLYKLAKSNLPTVVDFGRRILTAELAYEAIKKNVKGDFVETGVFTGGMTILMYKVLDKFGYMMPHKKKIYACDSFEGLPSPGLNDPEKDAKGKFSAGLETVKQNFNQYNVPEEAITIIPGWFNISLSKANIKSISFLRLDGDFYESTLDALNALYPKVSIGGLIYVDDYYSFQGCKKAVDEYRMRFNIASPLNFQYIPEQNTFDEFSKIEAVWWIKTG